MTGLFYVSQLTENTCEGVAGLSLKHATDPKPFKLKIRLEESIRR